MQGTSFSDLKYPDALTDAKLESLEMRNAARPCYMKYKSQAANYITCYNKNMIISSQT